MAFYLEPGVGEAGGRPSFPLSFDDGGEGVSLPEEEARARVPVATPLPWSFVRQIRVAPDSLSADTEHFRRSVARKLLSGVEDELRRQDSFSSVASLILPASSAKDAYATSVRTWRRCCNGEIRRTLDLASRFEAELEELCTCMRIETQECDQVIDRYRSEAASLPRPADAERATSVVNLREQWATGSLKAYFMDQVRARTDAFFSALHDEGGEDCLDATQAEETERVASVIDSCSADEACALNDQQATVLVSHLREMRDALRRHADEVIEG
jgi:hypothetical protein